MRKYRALIFDLDDTLYPERSFVVGGFHAAASWLSASAGRPAETILGELLAIHDRGIRARTFDLWLAENGLTGGERLDRLVRIYREHEPCLEPFPAVRGLLARLRPNYLLGVVSDGFHEVQARKLNALGLSDAFDTIVLSDFMGREAWKPSLRPFEAVLARLGVLAERALYVADNPDKDFLGPRRLGMATVRVRPEGGYYSQCVPPTPEHAPDVEIADIGLLEGYLHE